MAMTISWPVKTRELHNHHMDSTIWDEIKFRDNDIVVGTYAKSGTTWVQQMLAQMLLGPDPTLASGHMSPWVDMRLPPREEKLPALEAQTGRRFLKTHLPVDALTFSPHAKYLYIARDARDVMWSMHHHHMNFTAEVYEMFNNFPGLVGPKLEPANPDVHAYWLEWLENDGYPFWSLWENIRTWWAIRDLPNVMLLHFDDLKRDMPAQMQAIAAFLDIEVRRENWDKIYEYCTFDWMKANGDVTAPAGGIFWEGGGKTFINKGVNGRWRDVLSAEECAAYEAKARAELGDECAAWLATGARN